MAFTRVRGSGITTTDNYIVGVITATKFVGESGGSATFDNVSIGGSLTVNGDFTTLNTTLREVELLQVDANSSTTAGIITQRGSGDILNLFDNDTEVFSVTDGGNVSLGTGTPRQKLHIHTSDSGASNIAFTNTTTGTNSSDGFIVGLNGSEEGQIWNQESTNIKFGTGDQERLRIDSNGHVTIGIAANTVTAGYLQIPRYSGDGNAIELHSLRNDTAPADLAFYKNRSTSYGSYTATQSGDTIMSIASYVSTGSAYALKGLQQSYLSGSGIDYAWKTTASGSGQEKMRLTVGGGLLLGTTTAYAATGTGNMMFSVKKDATNRSDISISNQSSGDNASSAVVLATHGQDYILEATGSGNTTDGIRAFRILKGTSERLRITSDGRVGINQADPDAMLQIDYDYANSEVGLRLRAASGSGTKTWQLSEINGNAGVFTIRNATNGYNILNIDGANQRVGIGSAIPAKTLDIVNTSANADLRLKTTANSFNSFIFDSNRAADTQFAIIDGQWNGNVVNRIQFVTGSDGTNKDDGYMAFHTRYSGNNLQQRVKITTDGKLGINGNFTPSARVEIRDTIGGGGGTGVILNDIGSSGALEGLHIEWRSGSDKQADQCRIGQKAKATGSGSDFFIATNHQDTGSSTERLTITSNGNVLIAGTDANANVGADDLIVGTTSGTDNHGITIKSPTNRYGRLYFADGNSTPSWQVGQIEYNHANNELSVYTDGNYRARIDGNGKLLLAGASDDSMAFSGGDDLIIGTNTTNKRSGMTIVSHSAQDGGVYFSRGGSSNSEYVKGQLVYNHTNDYFAIYTGGTGIRLKISELGGHNIYNDSSYAAANLTECNNDAVALNIRKTRNGQTKAIAIGAIGTNTQTGLQAYDSSNNSANNFNINPFGGYLGIGLGAGNDPNELLHIRSSTSTAPLIEIEHNQGTGFKAQIGLRGNDLEIRGSSGQMEFYNGTIDGASSVERMRIKDDGKIGMSQGANVPNTALHILDNHTSSWDAALNSSRAVLRLETHWNAQGARAVGDYGSGIVFNHLGGHSGAHNNNIHAFIGLRIHGTPGHEYSKLAFATNSITSPESGHDAGAKEAMHIKPDGAIHMAYGTNDVGSTSNIEYQKFTVMPSSWNGNAYANRHVVHISQYNGNWEEDGQTGSTPNGYDSCWGLGWSYQANSGGQQNQRAGIAYDHKGTEEFKYWSSYGAHTWYVDGAKSGNETAETCSTKAMQVNHNGSIINTARPTYGIYTDASVQTSNGGQKAVQYLEDCYGQWIVVAKIQQSSHLQGAMASVAQIDTSLGQATGTEWSASFGDVYPVAVRYVSSSNWKNWRDNRGVDFIHGVPHGRKWKNFFSDGRTSGMNDTTGGVGSTKYGWTCDGCWDGKGRWHNPTFTWWRMSDIGSTPCVVDQTFFTTPTASNAATALDLDNANDAKFGVHATGATGGQDTEVTSVYGYDDNVYGHEDNYPNVAANHSGSDITAMPLWICLNVTSVGQFH